MVLSTGLAGRGWRVSIVALSGNGGRAAAEMRAAGIDVISLRMRRGLADPRGWIELQRWLRRSAPDILHGHLPHATWITRASRLISPVRVVIDTLHTPANRGIGQCMMYMATHGLSDCVTAVSRSVALAALSNRITTRRQIRWVPNAVDVNAWRPDAAVRAVVRKDLNLQPDAFLWCAVGRLETVKNYPLLLQAFALLPQSTRLIIAGSGAQEAKLTPQIGALGLTDRVRLLGFHSDVRPWLQAADGFVLSSLWEGLPICLLEAGSCQLPAVATNVAGNRDAIVDGETGILAPPANPVALHCSMHTLMQMRPQARLSMGVKARQRMEDYYNVERVLDQWENLYRELLDLNPHPRRFKNPHFGCVGAGVSLSAADGGLP